MRDQAHPITGIERGRAAYAFAEVKGFVDRNSDPKTQSKFRAYVKRLPSIIQVNGLAQALAFYYAKEEEHRQIYQIIAGRVKAVMPEVLAKHQEKEDEEFIATLVKLDSPSYRLVTREVLALLNWMGRFADGMITSHEA